MLFCNLNLSIILLSLGYSRLQVIRTVVFELFIGKIWADSLGLLYITLGLFILWSDVYRPFYMEITAIFLVLITSLICIYCIYLLMLGCVMIVYLSTRINRLALSLKGMKPHAIVQVANCFVKFVSMLLFIIAITFLVELYGQFTIERKNMQSWIYIWCLCRI